jgi:hypothetical protein
MIDSASRSKQMVEQSSGFYWLMLQFAVFIEDIANNALAGPLVNNISTTIEFRRCLSRDHREGQPMQTPAIISRPMRIQRMKGYQISLSCFKDGVVNLQLP